MRPSGRALGQTLANWRAETLAHHDTGASNRPTEGLKLCVKPVKRAGHGFLCFEHYRLRLLLHAGGVIWPDRPNPLRLRTRAPHSDNSARWGIVITRLRFDSTLGAVSGLCVVAA